MALTHRKHDAPLYDRNPQSTSKTIRIARVSLPVSLGNRLLVLQVVHTPVPFQPTLGCCPNRSIGTNSQTVERGVEASVFCGIANRADDGTCPDFRRSAPSP